MITNKSLPAPPKGGDLFIPPNKRKTLPMLKRGECRWPYGDPRKKNFYYCGKSKLGDHPYCGFHMRRAFQLARPREHRPYKSRQAA